MDATKTNLQDITPSSIVKAYIGKPGCMCGCKGKYYYAWSHPYGTVDLKMVTRILRTIQANEDLVEVDTDGRWIAAQVGGKEHVIYLAP